MSWHSRKELELDFKKLPQLMKEKPLEESNVTSDQQAEAPKQSSLF